MTKRCIPSRRLRPAAAQGFGLPLAMLGCFTLLLGSLSVQTVALEARLEQGASRRQRLAEDLLASAAQRLVGELNGHHRCLLALPLERWSEAGAGCAGAGVQTALRRGNVLGADYQLLAWQPLASGAGADLLLELEPPAVVQGAVQGAAQPGPRRAAFRVAMVAAEEGAPPRVVDLREQGLRGVTP